MRLWLAIFCGACLAAPAADAGGWLRKKGDGFVSTSNTLTDQLHTKSSFYLEFGLTAKTTIGVDIDMTLTGLGQTGAGQIFARRALPLGGAKTVWAYQVGLGMAFEGVAFAPLAQLGLSYGRSIKLGKYDGWLAVDTSAHWNFGTSVRALKIDTTAGLTLGARSKVMMQIFWTADSLGGTSTTLSPSYIYTPKRGKFSYLIAVESTQSTAASYGIKAGLERQHT